MRNYIIATLLFSILCACSTNNIEPVSSITNQADYDQALQLVQDKSQKEKDLVRTINQVKFWENKLAQQPTGYTFYDKLATVRDEQFELTGEVKYLEEVDTLYATATNLTVGNRKSNFLLKRSANAIKLHQFNKALSYAEDAYPLAKEKYGAILMMYDAYMELGMYDQASHIMNSQRNYESFDYLARYSKFLDHSGDLDSAVVVMENANLLVKDKNEDLYTWSLASLGDMYGHQGKVKKSYDTFLKVIKLDPTNHHVLKGIGYIAYAKDNNLQEAKKIFNAIDSQTKLPDYKLLLADIAQLENSQAEYDKLIQEFKTVAEDSVYKNLYKKYLIELYLDDKDKKVDIISIAQNEIDQRATPMTYQLLARAKLVNGEVAEAAQLINDHVIGKSFEPELVYNSGLILLEHGDIKNAEILLNEAKDAAFELGPLVMRNIEQSLNNI